MMGQKYPKETILSQMDDKTGKSCTFITENKVNSLKKSTKDIYGPCHQEPLHFFSTGIYNLRKGKSNLCLHKNMHMDV